MTDAERRDVLRIAADLVRLPGLPDFSYTEAIRRDAVVTLALRLRDVVNRAAPKRRKP